MKRVVIELSGGIAQIVCSPKKVEVEIIDLDVLREGDVDDITGYWNSLSLSTRRRLKRQHPEIVQPFRNQSAASNG